MRIRAAVSRDNAPAPVLEDVELAEPRTGEVLVRIVAAGICHTDLRAHAGGVLPTPRPVVLGHEGAGVVESVGPGVTGLKPGDHVVMSGSSCGLCPCCRSNLPSYCRENMPRNFGGARMDGSSALSQAGQKLHGHFFGQSSFATYAIADARGAVRIAPDIPLKIAAPLGCGVITGAGAVLYSFAMRAGQSLVVLGTGGVGLSAVMAARLVGASQIIAVDPLAPRRALALELGATAAIDPGSGDVVEAVRALLPGGADFVFNTTAQSQVIDAGLAMLGMRGVLGFVSAPPQPWTTKLFPLLAGGKSLRGILGGDAAPQIAIPLLLDYWRQGRFPLERLITHYSFDDIATAFGAVHNGSAIKPVLQMEQS